MHALYPKFVEPALFPLVAYIVSLVASWYGRRKYGEDGGLLDAARSLVLFYLGRSYLTAWHQEIGTAWIQYPTLTSTTFLILVPTLAFILIPRSLRQVLARQSSAQTGQEA